MKRLEQMIAGMVLAALCGCAKSAAPASPPITDLAGQVAKVDLAGGTYGEALPGLSPGDQARFVAGRDAFIRVETTATGLGPVFNGTFCASCHDAPPAVGGTNQRRETRFGRRNADGSFDPLAALGGPLLHDQGIGAVSGFNFAGETVPVQANVVARRRTQSVFGLGLVDATPDSSFRAIARHQAVSSPAAAGRAGLVIDAGSGQQAVGKFGWKAAFPTLLQFSGDAALNEMGITSPQFPREVCPGGDCSALAFNPRPDLNDPGGQDVERFTDFVRFLGPPPAPLLAGDALHGQELFASVGCAVCHLPLLVTGPSSNPALDRVAYHPYSDFLLHDMGSLGDGIPQGDALPSELRTQPLWGLSAQELLLHDGRAATASDAIAAHDGQGASAPSGFDALGASDRAALLAFLAAL